MARFDNKVVLVSGGARGQGAAEARLLVAQGAKVVIGDVLDHQGQALAVELGPAAAFVRHDVTSEADWARAVEAAQKLGGLHGLVNNAGIYQPATLMETDDALWQRHIQINQYGCFLGMKAGVPAMERSGGGSIVNISSAFLDSGIRRMSGKTTPCPDPGLKGGRHIQPSATHTDPSHRSESPSKGVRRVLQITLAAVTGVCLATAPGARAAEKVSIKVLYEDPERGEMTCLLKLEPGAHIPFHKHPEIEQTLVLEGSVEDHDGVATAGDYIWRKPGSLHDNTSPGGAVLFAVYRKPNLYYHAIKDIAGF